MHRHKLFAKKLAALLQLVMISLAAFWFGQTPAGAASTISSAGNGGGYTITLYTLTSATAPGNPGSRSTATAPNGKTLYPVMYPTVTTNSKLFSNAPCIAVYFAYYSSTLQASARQMPPQLWFTLSRRYPPCQYRTTSFTTPPSKPRLSITSYVNTITRQLPSPHPAMDPQFGLVGLNSYLTTGATLSDTLWVPSPAGTIRAVANGTLSADFGDGTAPVGPTTDVGGPWPGGHLVHAYGGTGCYAISVIENWSVSYDIGGITGTLNGLRTSGEIASYCVYSTGAVMLR